MILQVLSEIEINRDLSIFQIILGLEKKVQLLECEVREHTATLATRDHELAQFKDTVRHYVRESEVKNERIESLEEELHDLEALKQVSSRSLE